MGGEMRERTDDPDSVRRLVENERIAESLNRRVEERVEEMRAEDDEDQDAPVLFFCECSDLGCRERVSLRPRRFDAIHRDPALFVVVPGHELAVVETVEEHLGDYLVVRKHEIP
jgi:hypothetical protein